MKLLIDRTAKLLKSSEFSKSSEYYLPTSQINGIFAGDETINMTQKHFV